MSNSGIITGNVVTNAKIEAARSALKVMMSRLDPHSSFYRILADKLQKLEATYYNNQNISREVNSKLS